MAKKLQFWKNNIDGTTTTLDLMGGSSGFQLQTGWRPRVAPVRPGHPPARVTEMIPVAARGSDHDNLASLVQDLHAMQEAAARYAQDRTEAVPVWLRRQLENESDEARALVREIPLGFESGWYDALSVNNKARLMLPVVREGAWERISAITMGAVTPTAAAAVVFDHTTTADVVGDIPARIRYLVFRAVAGTTIGRLWMGFRSANKHRADSLANFVPIWEIEDGTLRTNAAGATDATASPGGGGTTKVRITPGTATWAERMAITPNDVITTGDEEDNYGRFLHLLRCQVSAGTWEVQTRVGYVDMPAANFVQGPIIEVSNTSWDYKEMGVFDYPLRDLHVFPAGTVGMGDDEYYEVQIWARRTAGAGTLDLDCFVPLPVDEGFMWTQGFTLVGATPTSGSDLLYIGESPEGRWQVLHFDYSAGGIGAVAEFAVDNFRPPVGDGRMVIVYADVSDSTLADQIDIYGISSFYPRWLSLRGAE